MPRKSRLASRNASAKPSAATITVAAHLGFWTTLVFALIERSPDYKATTWNPDTLPQVPVRGDIKLSDTIAGIVWYLAVLGGMIWAQAWGLAGEPIFEIVCETPWARKTNAETAYREIFAGIPDGLTFLSMHFNAPGDFEVINPEFAFIRTEEYALFRTNKIKEWVKEFGIELIGMRGLRDQLRARAA